MNKSVYVIRAQGGPVKVGIAKSPHKRLYALRTASPSSLFLDFVGECEAAALIEARAHELMAAVRAGGEWFNIDVAQAIAAVMTAAAELGYEIKPVALSGTKQRGRPRGSSRGVGYPVHLRLQPKLMQLLDDYRRSQPDLPSRQEAIKRLIEATADD